MIEAFIEARLSEVQRVVISSQMNINGLDVNAYVMEDVAAIRRLVNIHRGMNICFNPEDDAQFLTMEHSRAVMRIIASRWSKHKDYNPEWKLRSSEAVSQ